jgi:hypothetical protein
MYEAAQTGAQTNTSTTGIWAIIVVAVACLAFWLGAVALAARDPGVRHRRMPDLMGPVLGGTHVSDCHRSVAPSRISGATFADAEAEAMLGADADADADYGSVAATSGAPAASSAPAAASGARVPGQRVPGGAPVPSQPGTGHPGAGQPGAGQAEAPTVPAQRASDADQPRRAGAGG